MITGLIKSNLPARIAFQVASRTDSRVVLDENGADKLLGNGDMLFLSPGTSQLLRGQGTFLSDDEITRVVDFVATDAPQFAKELIELKTSDEEEAAVPGSLKNRDELYEAAVDVVVRERRGKRVVVATALLRHWLWPRGTANRLYGRRRHCRRIQWFASTRGDDYRRRVGNHERRRRGTSQPVWAADRRHCAGQASTFRQNHSRHRRAK